MSKGRVINRQFHEAGAFLPETETKQTTVERTL
jgi:hypothetical protein